MHAYSYCSNTGSNKELAFRVVIAIAYNIITIIIKKCTLASEACVHSIFMGMNSSIISLDHTATVLQHTKTSQCL